MIELIGAMLGAGMVLWWAFALLVGITFGLMVPLMAWSATRSVKGIRLELERLNASLEAARIAGGQVDVFTRTGPLNIR